MIGSDIVILVTEDDPGHAELIVDGLRDSGIHNRILRFADGLELLEYLEPLKSDASGVRIRDHLLLLDINMPRLDGIETLSRIKADQSLRDMPVIMLTTTDDPREIERCYRLGCNVYIAKPIDFSLFMQTLRRLGLFLQIIKT